MSAVVVVVSASRCAVDYVPLKRRVHDAVAMMVRVREEEEESGSSSSG